MKTHAPCWRLAALMTALLLVAACDESPPTSDLEISSDETVSLKNGGKPGGGTFSNWAYAASNGSKVDLLSFDGSISTTIAAGGSLNRYSPRFTEDGTEVAYLLGYELRVVGVDGANDRLLYQFGDTPGPWYGRFDWIPDSRTIIYRAYSDLYVVNTETGYSQALGWPALFWGDGVPREVSAGPDLDPQLHGFQGPIVSGWAAGESDLFVVMLREDPQSGSFGLDATKIARLELPDLNGGQNHPVFSPDGSRIAFQDRVACCHGDELKVVSFDSVAWSFSGDPVLLARSDITSSLIWISYQPTWSPYGSWIAYTGLYSGKGGYQSHLSVVNPQNSNDTFRLSSRLASFHPDWNPNWVP